MSTNDASASVTLDAEEVRRLIEKMKRESLGIFRDIIKDVKQRGNSISEETVNELAKKYADKARKIAGAGGE